MDKSVRKSVIMSHTPSTVLSGVGRADLYRNEMSEVRYDRQSVKFGVRSVRNEEPTVKINHDTRHSNLR